MGKEKLALIGKKEKIKYGRFLIGLCNLKRQPISFFGRFRHLLLLKNINKIILIDLLLDGELFVL